MEPGLATAAEYEGVARGERRRRLFYKLGSVALVLGFVALIVGTTFAGGEGDAEIGRLEPSATSFSAAHRWDSGVTDNGLRTLLASHPHLQELHVTQCPGITDAGLGTISRFSQLHELTLQGRGGFTSESLAQLAACPALRVLGLAGVSIDVAAAQAIAQIKNLEELTVSAQDISAEAMEILRKAKPVLQVRLIG